jgi:hypothetical protein
VKKSGGSAVEDNPAAGATFRLRALSTKVRLEDGETLMLIEPVDGSATEWRVGVGDRQRRMIPGDRWESVESGSISKGGRLVVLVTPTLIDPAGNPLNPATN